MATEPTSQHYPTYTVWNNVPVAQIQIGDRLAGGELEVGGIARAEHRGKPALRLDVEDLESDGEGRIVLTIDGRLSDVRRYEPSVRYRSTVTPTDATDPIIAAARTWADADGGSYEDDEQRLFAFICAAVAEYSRITDPDADTDRAVEDAAHDALRAVAENLCPNHTLLNG